MSVSQSEAITLRTYPYAEAHRIAVFFTRHMGLVRGVAHGSRGARSRFGSSLEPLTYLRLTFRRKENQDLATIQNCEIIRPFATDLLSWEQNLHFSYFTELLFEFGQEQEKDEKLFRLALATLQAASEVPIQELARYFELWLLQLEGILPPLDSRLSKELALKARRMMRSPPMELSRAVWEGAELKLLEGFACQLIEQHLEKRLKSRKMIQELL